MKACSFTTRGLTLVEVLITIAIMGVLASVVLAALNTARDKASIASAQVEIDALRKAFDTLYDDTRRCPNGADTFCRAAPPSNNEVDLSTSAAGLLSNGSSWTGWAGPYIASVRDPWGTPYYLDEDYDCTAGATGCRGTTDVGISVLVSCGPDRNNSGSGGSCTYGDDNVVYRLCD